MSSHPEPASRVQRAFLRELERVAGTDVTVLLEGEHGSGKGWVARMLHERSSRARGPFVSIDLAALSPSLVEAELFGHEEGAFTGATRAREGRFRRARGGALLLDGVDGLPLDLQAKLLRVLQEREVEPLGAESPVPIDARLVATCSAPLESAVEQGAFREDLFYRLAVVRLTVPPLRTRMEDLPALIEVLGAAAAGRVGVSARSFTSAALERLAAHPWPGNVRELENALERLMVLAEDRTRPVAVEELDFLGEGLVGAADRIAQEALAAGVEVEELVQTMLEAALAEARGNVSAAARRLGLSRRAFEYRLGKLRGNAQKTDEGGD